VTISPTSTYFKPRGIPLSEIEEVHLTVDELEALRHADLSGRYHEDASTEMNVSRQTFGRIVESARRKVADALVNGKALSIEDIDVYRMKGDGRKIGNNHRSCGRGRGRRGYGGRSRKP